MESSFNSSSGFLFSKGVAALAGLCGGLSVSFFHQPEKLHSHGKLAAGAIVGGVSVSASFALVGLIAKSFGMNFEDIDIALGLGYFVGLMSIGLVAWVANFLERRENNDILEVVQEVRGIHKSISNKKTPIKKPAAKKPTLKRVQK